MENLPVLGSDVKVCTCPASAYYPTRPPWEVLLGDTPRPPPVFRGLLRRLCRPTRLWREGGPSGLPFLLSSSTPNLRSCLIYQAQVAQ